MPTILTLGPDRGRTKFEYTGTVADGVVLHFSGNPRVSAEFFQAILGTFEGRTIPGGFSMTDPTPGGLGKWIQSNSRQLNPVRLTPRHASFIAAILVHEGRITSNRVGNGIELTFPLTDILSTGRS